MVNESMLLAYFASREFVWTMATGETIDIKDMEVSHLKNAHNLIVKKIIDKQVLSYISWEIIFRLELNKRGVDMPINPFLQDLYNDISKRMRLLSRESQNRASIRQISSKLYEVFGDILNISDVPVKQKSTGRKIIIDTQEPKQEPRKESKSRNAERI